VSSAAQLNGSTDKQIIYNCVSGPLLHSQTISFSLEEYALNYFMFVSLK
jgi:hypothetical protein